MSPAAAFHAQLSSIMEVLANTAVAEICELVDSGYSVLQLEISRSRKENEVLRRKLRLMELRAARTTALRAAATGGGGGGALLCASGRARALLPGHHPGNDPRRSRTPRGEVVLPRQPPQDLPQREDPEPPSDSVTEPPQPAAAESANLTTAVIKVEVEDESWSQSEQSKQAADTEAPPPVTKQETASEDDSSRSWASGEVSSTSTFVQKPMSSGQRSDSGGYECVMYEPQLQHGPHPTQNPLGEDPGCSYSVNASVLSVSADSGGGSFPFTITEVSLTGAEHQQPAGPTDGQRRAPPAPDQPQPPVRKEVTGNQNAFVRRDGWRQQDGASRATSHSREDSGGKFVCSCCGKTLACLKNLKTHMRVHTGEKPFGCSLCGKCFSDSSNLKRHQNVHTGEKRYGCVHCGKRFAQSGSLKVHMTMHTDCKQFRCVYCGKMFISGSHLRRHITVHAGEKPFMPTLQ